MDMLTITGYHIIDWSSTSQNTYTYEDKCGLLCDLAYEDHNFSRRFHFAFTSHPIASPSSSQPPLIPYFPYLPFIFPIRKTYIYPFVDRIHYGLPKTPRPCHHHFTSTKVEVM